MRILLLAFTLTAAGVFAQAPPAHPANTSASDWTHVQVLSPGTNILIKSIDHGSVRCDVVSTTADSVTCGSATFQQANIRSIKSSHRVRSSLVGVAVGYGTAAVVTILGAYHCRNLNCSLGYAAFLGIFDVAAIIVTPIVFGFGDLTAGTIYKNPAYS